MSQPTSAPAQIVADTIVRTVELGVRITDAAIAGETTVLWCELLTDGPGRCPGCGLVGAYRDSVERRVTDVPVVGHPLELRVRLPRYRCVHGGCDREVFAHDSSRLARPGWSTTRRCAGFVLRRLAIDKATISAVARELGRSWDTVNAIAVAATGELLTTAGPARLDGVRVMGVDEHKWSHVLGANADGFVTVITDLTPVLAGHGPARLLDMVPGAPRPRWPAGWPPAIRASGIGWRSWRWTGSVATRPPRPRRYPTRSPSWTRSTSSPSRARSWTCAASASSRTPSDTAAAPATRSTACGARCAPAPGCSPSGSATRIGAVFADDAHAAVEVTWAVYQQLIDAYAQTDPQRGKTLLSSPDRAAPPRPAGRAGGTRPARADAAPPPRRRPGLLHPPRLERADRGHQRPPRSPTTQRPRVPQPDQLPHPLTTALRISCTLIPEES